MEAPEGSPHHNVAHGQNVVQAQNVHGDVHIHNARSDSAVIPHELPATVRHFVNRTVEQDALTTLLNGTGDEHALLLSTVDGLAGVGKSTLVVQWAHRMRERFPDGELYANLRGYDPAAEPMPPFEALAGFLTALGVAADEQPATEDARAARFRSLVHGRRMLIVLDNARDADQVLPLLPGAAGCLVVVTSRQRLDELVSRHGAHRIALDELTRDEGHALLARYLGAERLGAEPEAVGELLEHCAGLPLALTLVAVQAAAEPDLRDLADDLADERERLDALDAGGRTGIRAVFSHSYRALPHEAARLFRLLGLPSSPDIGLGAAAALAGIEPRRARRVLGELCRARLLNRTAAGRYAFHDLLRAYARECAHADETEADRTAALRRLLDHHLYATYAASRQLAPNRDMVPLDHVDPVLDRSFTGYDEALEWWDTERAAVLATVRQTSALGMARSAWLAEAAGYPLRLRGHIRELEDSSTAGIEAARCHDDRAALARLNAAIGESRWRRGEWDGAIEHTRIAAELFGELGNGLWSALMTSGLAHIHLDAGRPVEAVAAARRAKTTMDELDTASVGEVVVQQISIESVLIEAVLGVALAHCGEFDEAFARLRRAEAVDGDEFGRGYVLHRLGTAHRLAGEPANAVDAFRRAVEHRRTIGHTAGEGESLAELGRALREHGDPEAARTALQQALAILDPLAHTEADAVRDELDALDATE